MNKEEFFKILDYGRELGCSDIHISQGNFPGYRVQGKIHKYKDYHQITPAEALSFYEMAIDYLPDDLKEFKTAEVKKKGHCGFAITVGEDYRYRVNSAKYDRGFYTVMRTLTTSPADLGDLGFSVDIFNALKIVSAKKAGLFLVVGPTGSGKSTTLAALIKEVNQNYEKNIITLEDPIEYTHQELSSNIVQKEVGRDIDEFSEGLRAALREDPDVILIGEIRDEETLDLSLKAAETGHLVFATLHTDNTVSTIKRIVSMTDNEDLTRDRLSATLLAVIAQRLEPIDEIDQQKAIHSGMALRKGGRIINYEMLSFTPSLLSLLKDGKSDLQIAAALDNTPLSQSYNQTLYNYLKDGRISREECMDMTSDKKDMLSKIGDV